MGWEIFNCDIGAGAEPLSIATGCTWLRGTYPVLGSTAIIRVATCLLGISVSITMVGILADRPMSLGAFGVLHIDLTQFFHTSAAGQGARLEHDFPIPNVLVLIGIQVEFQTIAFDASNFIASFELSNGLHWTLGNSVEPRRAGRNCWSLAGCISTWMETRSTSRQGRQCVNPKAGCCSRACVLGEVAWLAAEGLLDSFDE